MKRLRKSVSRDKLSASCAEGGRKEEEGRTNSKVTQPLTRLLHVLVQPPQHHARMLARQVILRLANVERHEARPLPEPEQRRCNSIRHAEVVQVLRLSLAQPLQERRHLRCVADADAVGREGGGRGDLGGVGESLDFEFGGDFVEVEELAGVERVEGLDGTRSVAHFGVVGVDGDADDASAGEGGEVVVLVLSSTKGEPQVREEERRRGRTC
jgi:hypothetical protein